MKQQHRLTIVIERENDGYVSFCPDLDIASQGDTIEEARHNLLEAVELFLETASLTEINGIHSANDRKKAVQALRALSLPVSTPSQMKRESIGSNPR